MNPDTLVAGSDRLSDVHEAMRAVLDTVRSSQNELRGAWTGATSDIADGKCSELLSNFTQHLDKLAENVADMRTAADLYRTQDEESGTDIAQQM